MEKLIKSQNGQWTLTKAAPKLDSGHSVFTMDHVNEVSKMRDHGKAKEYAHSIVDSSSAQPHNKYSIKNMIDKSKSAQNLAFGMSNHVLAHPSEGLKVVKEEGSELAKEESKLSAKTNRAMPFTMRDVHDLHAMKDHDAAKTHAHSVIDSYGSSIKPAHKDKLKSAVNSSKDSADLAYRVANHVIGSHPESKPHKGRLQPHAEAKDPTPVDEYLKNPKKYIKSSKDTDTYKTEKMAKDEDGSEMLFSQLESIAHHVKEIRESMKPSEDSPDWVNAKITEAAKQLSDVAHYVQGEKAVAKADGQKPNAHDRDTAQRYRDMPASAKGSSSKQPSIGQREVDSAVRTVEANLPKILKPKK